MMKEFMQREDFLKEIEKLESEIILLKDGLTPIGEQNEFIELEGFRKLKSTLFPLIERLWILDNGTPFEIIKGEKKEIINTIVYRITNEWID
jgi:hypothetical protein